MKFEYGEPVFDENERAAFDVVYDRLIGIILAWEDTCDDEGIVHEPLVSSTPYAAAAALFDVLSSFMCGTVWHGGSRSDRMRYLRYAAGVPVPLPKGHDPTIQF